MEGTGEEWMVPARTTLPKNFKHFSELTGFNFANELQR
jgi:hypothetical protein